MTLTQITEKGIKDGEILNADINASAAIARTKLANVDVVDDTSPQLGGDLDTNSHNIKLDDNHYVYFGDGDDFSIRHDGTYNRFKGANFIFNNAAGNESIIEAYQDGAVNLYYNNSKKLETYSNGVVITGTVAPSSINLNDNNVAYFGTGADLQIYHSGTESWIKETGTGGLYLASDRVVLQNAATDETMAKFQENGACELYHDNGKVFETGIQETRHHRRVQIHADGPGSGHGMSIGQWDGSNHRIEGDANRPLFITAYNSGGIKMGVSGANKVAVNSHGIVFNGDTAAANALDDYEEGTWTPNLVDSSATFSFSHQTGKYVKVGRMVNIQCFIYGYRTVAGSGNIRLGGLPFTIREGDMTQLLSKDVGLAQYPSNWNYLTGYGMNGNDRFVLFYKKEDGSGHNLDVGHWSTNSNSPSYIYANATYFTDS